MLALKLLRSARELPAACAALAIGVGLTGAAYGLIDAVLLRPLPYADPQRLVQVWNSSAAQSERRLSERDQAVLASDRAPFESLAAFERTSSEKLEMGSGRAPYDVAGARVSVNLFDVLGVRPIVGRTFQAEDSGLAESPAIVVSERLVRSGLIRGQLGEILGFQGLKYRVVGVMPASFWFPDRAAVFWVPIPVVPAELAGSGAVTRLRFSVGRLPQGLTAAGAEARANARLTNRGTRVQVASYQDLLRAPLRPSLLALQAAASLVLLLVLLNVSWLMLARARRLERAFATMRALGSTPARIACTSLSFALAAGTIAAPIALLLAWSFLRVGMTMENGLFSRIAEPALTLRVMVMSCGMTLVAAFAAAVPATVAAVQASRRATPGMGTATRRTRFERTAVVGQVAVVFAVGALAVLVGLILRSLMLTNVGLPRTDFIAARIEPRTPGPVDPVVQVTRLRELLAGLERRGIASAAAEWLPLSGGDSRSTFEPRRSRDHARAMVRRRIVSPSYFEITGLRPTTGRVFTDRDRGAHLAVVTESFASAVLQDRRGVLGERTGGRLEWTVVGVVPTTRQSGVREEIQPEVYVSYDDYLELNSVPPGGFSTSILMRQDASDASITAILRQELERQMPDFHIRSVLPMSDLIALNLGADRLVVAASASFAIVALLLSALGLYAMVGHDLASRRREIGIRMALGATRERIAVESARPVAALSAIGALAGLVIFLLAKAAVESVVAPPPDAAPPAAWLVAAITLGLMATAIVLACYSPIRIATETDPAISLRES